MTNEIYEINLSDRLYPLETELHLILLSEQENQQLLIWHWESSVLVHHWKPTNDSPDH